MVIDNEQFPDDDQASMMPPGIEKYFGTNPLFTEESILKSMYYIPQGNVEDRPEMKFITFSQEERDKYTGDIMTLNMGIWDNVNNKRVDPLSEEGKIIVDEYLKNKK